MTIHKKSLLNYVLIKSFEFFWSFILIFSFESLNHSEILCYLASCKQLLVKKAEVMKPQTASQLLFRENLKLHVLARAEV